MNYKDNMETAFYGFLNQREEIKEGNARRLERGQKIRRYPMSKAKKQHLVKLAKYWVRAGGAV